MARKMKTMDGNHAAAHASYAYTDVAAIYPDHSFFCYGRSYRRMGNSGKKEHFRSGQFRLQRCSPRLVQQVLYTDLWQQVL